MKKLAVFILLLLILCAMVFTGFYFMTQRGVFASEVSLLTPGQSSPVFIEKLKINEDNLLLDALRSSVKVDAVPPRFSHELTLVVDYRLDITKTYAVYINPYTGEGCIEKGLIREAYYILSPETMDYIAPVKSVSIQSGDNGSEAYIVDNQLYDDLRNSLSYLGGQPAIGDITKSYTVNVETTLGIEVQYFLVADLESQKVYANMFNGYYSISDKVSKNLLSSEAMYADYQKIMQPFPNVLLSPGSVKTPVFIDRRWNRVSPAGETVNDDAVENTGNTRESIEPGLKITVNYNPDFAPDGIILYESRNGIPYQEYDLLKEDVYVPLFEGDLDYTLKSIYEHETYPTSYGTVSMDYSFTIDLPTKSEMVYREARPGDILAFFVDFAEETESFSLESNLGNFSADFMPYGSSHIIYMPINWWTTPKDYYALVYRHTDDTKELFAEYTVTVLPDDFVIDYQYLEVSDELKEKTDPVNTANDGVLVREAKSNPNPTSYVEGTFIMPLDGELGTSYAMTRYINGENPYRHSGLDIDGETGDPIKACNNGVIVFAGPLVRPGNTVIIDHGMGLYTSYLHLSGFAVEVGDYVEKGDVVAYVGSTGFSTGPHLHWSVTLHGNYVSPLWLVNNAIVPD